LLQGFDHRFSPLNLLVKCRQERRNATLLRKVRRNRNLDFRELLEVEAETVVGETLRIAVEIRIVSGNLKR